MRSESTVAVIGKESVCKTALIATLSGHRSKGTGKRERENGTVRRARFLPPVYVTVPFLPPFKLIEGEPLETSYGQDLYGKIFGAAG